MSIESVLVYLHAEQNTEAVLDVAIDIARRHRAHLAGLYVSAGKSAEPGAATLAPAPAFEGAFRERAETARLSHAWSVVSGNPDRLVALEARCHDLLILGQGPSHEGTVWARHRDPVERVLVKGGSALIAVPYHGSGRSVGERVVVAWNGGPEVARAVEGALPILEQARRVIVLTVDRRSGQALSVDHLMRRLLRHGVNVEARGGRSQGRPVGDALLATVRELECDLLVMGGYGHWPIREHLFGGATDAVLRHMTVPVLLSH
jgi:nucleotide-binding universal stress UspA family protein